MCVWSFGPNPTLEATAVGLTACVARIHSFNLSLLPSLDFRESRDKVSARTCVKVFTYVLHFWVHLVQKVSKPEEQSLKGSVACQCVTQAVLLHILLHLLQTHQPSHLSLSSFIFHIPPLTLSDSCWIL